jgi:hypothetical protein
LVGSHLTTNQNLVVVIINKIFCSFFLITTISYNHYTPVHPPRFADLMAGTAHLLILTAHSPTTSSFPRLNPLFLAPRRCHLHSSAVKPLTLRPAVSVPSPFRACAQSQQVLFILHPHDYKLQKLHLRNWNYIFFINKFILNWIVVSWIWTLPAILRLYHYGMC